MTLSLFADGEGATEVFIKDFPTLNLRKNAFNKTSHDSIPLEQGFVAALTSYMSNRIEGFFFPSLFVCLFGWFLNKLANTANKANNLRTILISLNEK